jgi:hypothetical protein
VILRRRAPYLAVGWLWFVGMVFPVCGLFQAGTQAYADRFTYLPHVGLLLAVVWGAADLANRARVSVAARWVVVALLATACAVQCERLIPNWRSTWALYSRVAEVQPDAPDGWFTLALICFEEERYEEAFQYAAKAFKTSPDTESLIYFEYQLRERIRIKNELARIRGTKRPPPPPPPPPPP